MKAPRRVNLGPGYPLLEVLGDDHEGRKQIVLYLDGNDEPALHLKLDGAGRVVAILPGDGALEGLIWEWRDWLDREDLEADES